MLPADFAERLAPLAGFRNILVHEYLAVDWDEVYRNLQRLDDLYQFAEYVRNWLKVKPLKATSGRLHTASRVSPIAYRRLSHSLRPRPTMATP